MNFFVQRSELRDLYDKAAAGELVSSFGRSFWMNLIWVVPMIIQWRVVAGKRRQQKEVFNSNIFSK